jgi:hypothetical protein
VSTQCTTTSPHFTSHPRRTRTQTISSPANDPNARYPLLDCTRTRFIARGCTRPAPSAAYGTRTHRHIVVAHSTRRSFRSHSFVSHHCRVRFGQCAPAIHGRSTRQPRRRTALCPRFAIPAALFLTLLPVTAARVAARLCCRAPVRVVVVGCRRDQGRPPARHQGRQQQGPRRRRAAAALQRRIQPARVVFKSHGGSDENITLELRYVATLHVSAYLHHDS